MQKKTFLLATTQDQQIPERVHVYIINHLDEIFQHAIRPGYFTGLSLDISIPVYVNELSAQHFMLYWSHKGYKKGLGQMTKEEREATYEKGLSSLTEEKREAAYKKSLGSMTNEERDAAHEKGLGSMTKEGREAAYEKGLGLMTKEERESAYKKRSGKKRPAETCAKISKVLTGKKSSA